MEDLEIFIRAWLSQENRSVHDGTRYHSTVTQVDTSDLVMRAMQSNWMNVSWKSMGYRRDVGDGGSERASRGEIKA